MSSSRYVAQAEEREEPEPRGMVMPKWALLLLVGLLLAILGFRGVQLSVERAALSKGISDLRSELRLADEHIGLLQVQIDQASDPNTVHTYAVNVLGMSLPEDERIITITLPPSP
jgi:hypothetical protein